MTLRKGSVIDPVLVGQRGGEALQDVGHDALMCYLTGFSANGEIYHHLWNDRSARSHG